VGRAVTVISSALGTRIDCDRCGRHAATASLSLEALRRTTGYAQLDGRDYCPQCRKESIDARIDSPRARPSDTSDWSETSKPHHPPHDETT
jgi:hypothetical protein